MYVDARSPVLSGPRSPLEAEDMAREINYGSPGKGRGAYRSLSCPTSRTRCL